MAGRPKGGVKFGGRKKGTKNRVTATVKDAILHAYNAIGGDDAFSEWANAEKTEFYKIYSRLVPLDLQANGEITITVNKMVDNLPGVDLKTIDAKEIDAKEV